MREISVNEISKNIKEMCIQANHFLSEDMRCAFREAEQKEKSPLGRQILDQLEENLKIAGEDMIPICQDTGMAVVFLKVGQEVHFVDGNITDAVNEGVRQGYVEGYLRKSVVKDSSARSIRLDLPKFTLVGATTRAGLLTAPLRDRFGVVQRLEFYTPKELCVIVKRSADVLGVEIDDEGAWEIARRSRGTPRLANRLLKRVRDFAQVKYNGVITRSVADFALDILDVDKLGLDNNDRTILLTMIQKFGGGPVGLETLAASIGEDAGTLEDVYEPYLLMNGLINRTPRGRVATENAYRHLDMEMEKQ